MAGVVTRESAPAYAAITPRYGIAARKYTTEFIGAFFLTFAVAMAALSGSVFVPLAAGATLMVMIYAGGHISGGHYNPAVTMAALVRRRIGISDAIPYWIVQAVAGIAAGALARALVNPATVRTLTLSGHTEAAAAVVEVLITFALCYVVLNVATSKDQKNNGFFGLAIGFTVAAGAVRCRRHLRRGVQPGRRARRRHRGPVRLVDDLGLRPRRTRRGRGCRPGVPGAQPRRQVTDMDSPRRYRRGPAFTACAMTARAGRGRGPARRPPSCCARRAFRTGAAYAS